MLKRELAPVRELQSSLAARRKSSLLQDLGLLVYLFSVLAAALTLAFCGEGRRVEYAILFALMGASALLAAYRFRYLAAGLTGLQILTFSVYTLFRALVQGEEVIFLDYAWAFLPLFSLLGMQIFVREMYEIEKTNEKLNAQMESVVLLDPLTGLYNLRAMYIDLQRQMAYCSRNKVPISLMIVRLRYRDELYSLLHKTHFDQMIQRAGALLSGSVRIEDRCYALDTQKGEFAVLLTCNKAGSDFVRKRVEAAFAQRDAFAGIVDSAIRVDLRIACVEYEEGITNAIEFKRKVDSELQYDV